MPAPRMGQTGQKYQAPAVITSVSQIPIITTDVGVAACRFSNSVADSQSRLRGRCGSAVNMRHVPVSRRHRTCLTWRRLG